MCLCSQNVSATSLRVPDPPLHLPLHSTSVSHPCTPSPGPLPCPYPSVILYVPWVSVPPG